MNSKFYLLEINNVLNGYFLGDSKKGPSFIRKPKNTNISCLLEELCYISQIIYLVGGYSLLFASITVLRI